MQRKLTLQSPRVLAAFAEHLAGEEKPQISSLYCLCLDRRGYHSKNVFVVAEAHTAPAAPHIQARGNSASFLSRSITRSYSSQPSGRETQRNLATRDAWRAAGIYDRNITQGQAADIRQSPALFETLSVVHSLSKSRRRAQVSERAQGDLSTLS